MQHMITTVVPTEIAPLLSELAAFALRERYLNVDEAGHLMAFANSIVASADKTPRPFLYDVPAWWRMEPSAAELPGVVVTISEDDRREVAIAAGSIARRAFQERPARLGSLIRDWARYDLRDGCTTLVFHV